MLKVIKGGTPPKIKTKYSSCADLCAREEVVIQAGETKTIPLGVKIDLEELKKIVIKDFLQFGNSTNWNEIFNDKAEKEHDKIFENFLKSHSFELKLRSSLGKRGLILPNGVGEIDIDYPDEIMMIIHNPISLSVHDIIGDNEYSYILDETKTIIKAGERVAQIKLMEHKNYLMPERFKSDEARKGGFGSTN